MDEILILQQTEFMILAVAVNYTRIYGILPEQELDEKTFMYGMHEMIEKNILKVEESNFVIQEPYRTAILSMKNAESILSMTGNDDSVDNTCFYLGEKIVVLEASTQDTSAIRISVHDREDLYKLLLEKGFLPEPFVEPDIACLQQEDEMKETLGGIVLSDEETMDNELIYAKYTVMVLQGNSEPEQRDVFLLNNPYNYWIAEEMDGETYFCHYDKETLYEKLNQLTDYGGESEGGSYDIG